MCLDKEKKKQLTIKQSPMEASHSCCLFSCMSSLPGRIVKFLNFKYQSQNMFEQYLNSGGSILLVFFVIFHSALQLTWQQFPTGLQHFFSKTSSHVLKFSNSRKAINILETIFYKSCSIMRQNINDSRFSTLKSNKSPKNVWQTSWYI